MLRFQIYSEVNVHFRMYKVSKKDFNLNSTRLIHEIKGLLLAHERTERPLDLIFGVVSSLNPVGVGREVRAEQAW